MTYIDNDLIYRTFITLMCLIKLQQFTTPQILLGTEEYIIFYKSNNRRGFLEV